MSEPRELDLALRQQAADAGRDDVIQRGRAAIAALETSRPQFARLISDLCAEIAAVRRQGVRLGLDLHDGGLQDLAALRADLEVFRQQIDGAVQDRPLRRILSGRIDDFVARVAAVDTALRELATSAQAVDFVRQPLSRALVDVVAAHEGTQHVVTRIDPGLDAYPLSDSQRIAIVRVVQSALANVAQHSGASLASVRVRCSPMHMELRVLDNGIGFDVERIARIALCERRLGIAGMRERVRLLDGTFEIASRPGGPTRVLVRLPPRPT